MTLQPMSGSRLRLVGAGILIATFVAGALAGAALHQVAFAGDRVPAAAAQVEGDRGDRHDHERSRANFYRGLGLSPEQQTRMDAVFERRSEQLDRFWREIGRPHMKAISDSTRAEINGILTPEQRAELERRREARKARERAERESARREDGSGSSTNQ